MNLTVSKRLCATVLTFALASATGWAQDAPSVTIQLPNTTQGPFWPPSEILNKDGNFILVGQVMTQISPGTFLPVPNQAVLVSKDTVPPLDKNGVEDPSNWFGAAYKVVRPLDLSPASADLDTILYSDSFGPVVGPHGRAPRIPRAGDSRYNLNGDYEACPEVFPSESQKTTYTRPSYPLHMVPVWGFQGDGVLYDVDTGEPHDAHAATGPGCPFDGCPGEDNVDSRRTQPITLGDWLKAQGTVKITATHFDAVRNGYTHARFEFKLRNMLPNALYSVWAVRPRVIPTPDRERRPVGPLGVPNVFVTDADGNTDGVIEVPNPFPEQDTDDRGMRIIALSMVYHSDQQTWGACFDRFGPGISAHAVFSTLANGSTSLVDFNTIEPQ
jgi:hypothetical protein